MDEVSTVSLQALRDFWHPVAFSSDVTDMPFSARLLEQTLCLYRDSSGRPVAMNDLCIHRGTPLTLGWIDGDNIVCAYHGWSYDQTGRCIRIPSISEDRRIPPKARVDSYAVADRYGLVWVCLGGAKADIAEFPEYEDDSFRTFLSGSEDWDANAARLIENFIDTAHFAWVHPGLLGQRDEPEVPPITVRQEDFTIEVSLEMGVRTTVHQGETSRIWNEITLPFTVRQVRTDPEGGRHVVFVAISPLSRGRLRRFFYKMRDYALDAPDDPFIEKSKVVASQDRAIVEQQRPEELPIDLTAELHVKGPDDPALVYRKALGRLGVDVA